MTLPNFLIIGAAKAATSSIFNYLTQHPDVYGPAIKEPAFFAFENETVDFKGPGDERLNNTVVTDFDKYLSLFDDVKEEKVIGEASVVYLYDEQAAYRIRHYVPDMKIIVIIRNPVDRAFSSYGHLKRDGRETLMTLGEALKQEEIRKKNNWQHLWHYAEMGFYYDSLKRYYEQFPAENIAVYTYDEFKSSPIDVLKKMFKFLEIDETFLPEMSRKYNVTGVPRSKILHSFLHKPSAVKEIFKKIIPGDIRKSIRNKITDKNIMARKTEIEQSTRELLQNMYREDILKTQDLVKKDLKRWLD